MDPLLLYFGKLILTSGVLFLYYRLFLKDRTFHHYNRFYLLAMVVVSLLLPLLKVSYFTLEVNRDLYLLLTKLNTNPVKTNADAFNYTQFFAIIFGVVSLFFLVRFLLGIIKISKLKRTFPKEYFDGIHFYQTDLNNAPFSYFKNLFWKNSIQIESDLGKQILKHEMVHMEQNHTFDKILMEVVKSVFWFNPFFYLVQKEIHLIHEYLADNKALKHTDTKAFAQMLLASRFSGKMIPATSPFLSSNLKKRLKMLQKPKTQYSYARRIFALPLLFSLAFVYLINAKNKEIRATNLEIKQVKETLKEQSFVAASVTDTIPKSEAQEKVRIDNHFKEANAEIAKLGESIQQQSKELKTLAPESEEYSQKVDAITALSNRINGITSSEEYQKNIDKSKQSPFVVFVEKDMVSPKKQDARASIKNNGNSIKVHYGEDGTFIYQNNPELFIDNEVAQSNNTSVRNKTKEKLSKERRKLAEKQRELSQKQKELARQQAELAAKAVDASNSTRKRSNVVIMNKPVSGAYSNNIVYLNSNDLTTSKVPQDIHYFIDGKEASESDMKALDQNNIAAIHVFKNDHSAGEIRITTKK